MKKYGYVGAGVYTVLSVIDLSLTMAIISIKGADRVKQAEDYVLDRVKGLIGISHDREGQQHDTTDNNNDHPSLTTIFLAAYGIHKTILLPVRLSLTAAITPKVARSIRNFTRK
ncbi:hypothetical protein BX666DRAFT_1855976 [Dichotomocladium elegans]|nr:hypothetical protein BX666DRAFT_1855976 [Dichotomocladium elegans]